MPFSASTRSTTPLSQIEPWKLLLAAFSAGMAFTAVSAAGITWLLLQALPHPA